MPAAFSAEEKKRITDLLLDNGYLLFTTQGLRKTSLDDLVRPAGIAKSSFYAFFASKEALYLELMTRQMARVKHRVVDNALLRGTGTRDALRRFLRATLKELDTDPLYRRLMTHPEELEAVSRKVDRKEMEAMAGNPATALVSYLAERRKDEELIDADPAVLVGVLQAVLLLPMHASTFGDHYPRVLDLMIDIVTAGITHERNV